MISKCNLSKFQMDEVSFTASKPLPEAPALGHFVLPVWSRMYNKTTNNTGRDKGKLEGSKGRGYLNLVSNKLKFLVTQESFPNHSMKSNSVHQGQLKAI